MGLIVLLLADLEEGVDRIGLEYYLPRIDPAHLGLSEVPEHYLPVCGLHICV